MVFLEKHLGRGSSLLFQVAVETKALHTQLKIWRFFSQSTSKFCDGDVNRQNFTEEACIYSAIHKSTGLMVPGRSMILPGTIPETPTSHEWGQRLEQSPGVIPARRMPGGDFVNSAVNKMYLSFGRMSMAGFHFDNFMVPANILK